MTSLIIGIYSSHLRGCSWFQRGLFDNDFIIQIANAQQSTIANHSPKEEQQLTTTFKAVSSPFPMCPLSQPHTIGVHQRPQLAADSVRASDVAAAEALRGDAGGVAAAAIRRLQPGYGGYGAGCES
jgi:hypothetical protein